MAKIRYTQSAKEMIPRIIFSIKIWSEFFAAERVKRERGEKHEVRSDVNGIEHNYSIHNAVTMNATTP